MIDIFRHLSVGPASILGFLFGGILGPACLIVLYVAVTYPSYVIAQRLNHPNPWYAFVPILHQIQAVELAELDIIWAILYIIPCTSVVGVYVWMKLAAKLGKPEWVAILLLVPPLTFFVPYYIAMG